MMMRRFAPVAIGAVASLLLLGGCAQPTARLAGVNVKGADFNALTLALDIAVDNPNPVALDVSGLDWSFTAADEQVIEGATAVGSRIEPNGVGHIDLPVRIPYRQVVAAWQRAGITGSLPYRLDGELGFNVAGVPVTAPISHSGELPLSILQRGAIQERP